MGLALIDIAIASTGPMDGFKTERLALRHPCQPEPAFRGNVPFVLILPADLLFVSFLQWPPSPQNRNASLHPALTDQSKARTCGRRGIGCAPNDHANT
ncbi:hypothetical protein [Primorskyibacter sedentarius]|uniref:hypothetical protein n=1 Tax=Primorskyibacter sedentarius TaxID=745311 RepID=UPI001404E843|nr:hypothetical protein [Primorskyibacter sedentarius]